MALESIKKIEEIEKEAEKTVNAATIEKEQIIGDALKEGEGLVHKKRLVIKEEKQDLLNKAKKEAEQQIEKLSKETQEQVAELEKSKSDMNKVVDFIIKQITK